MLQHLLWYETSVVFMLTACLCVMWFINQRLGSFVLRT